MKSLALFALLSIISACMTRSLLLMSGDRMKYKLEKPTKTWRQYLDDAYTQVEKLDKLLNRVKDEKKRADVSKAIAMDFKFALFTAIMDWEGKVLGKKREGFYENFCSCGHYCIFSGFKDFPYMLDCLRETMDEWTNHVFFSDKGTPKMMWQMEPKLQKVRHWILESKKWDFNRSMDMKVRNNLVRRSIKAFEAAVQGFNGLLDSPTIFSTDLEEINIDQKRNFSFGYDKMFGFMAGFLVVFALMYLKNKKSSSKRYLFDRMDENITV